MQLIFKQQFVVLLHCQQNSISLHFIYSFSQLGSLCRHNLVSCNLKCHICFKVFDFMHLCVLLTLQLWCADPHPGNIAVDAAGGGRLIYYDFGMMGVIPSDIRSGLLELFYGVYEKNSDR